MAYFAVASLTGETAQLEFPLMGNKQNQRFQ